MKEDIPGIIGGLKNAIERGSSLEKAKFTFISAGYDENDVEEAARTLMPAEAKKPAFPLPKFEIEMPKKGKDVQPLPEIPKPAKKKKNFIRTVIIVVAVIIFLLILNILRTILGIGL